MLCIAALFGQGMAQSNIEKKKEIIARCFGVDLGLQRLNFGDGPRLPTCLDGEAKEITSSSSFLRYC